MSEGRYLVELAPLAGVEAPGSRDLARLLKALLRRYGYRLVTIRRVEPEHREVRPVDPTVVFRALDPSNEAPVER